MRFSSIVVACMVVLALAAGVIDMKLTRLHIDETPAEGIFADLCSPEGNSGFDCKVVVKTKWSVLPPSEPDPVTHRQEGLPVALVGWWYFTAIGLWYLIVGRCDYTRRGWHFLLLLFIAFGCAVSLFYLYILYFTPIPAKCPWCIISHGINFLVLIGTLLLIPRKSAATHAADVATASAEGGAPGAAQLQEAHGTVPAVAPRGDEAGRAHPAGRLVAAAVVAIFAMVWCEFKMVTSEAASMRATHAKRQADACMLTLGEFYRDDETLWNRYESQTPVNIAIRPDDPARGTGNMLLPMVVFSDFQCPACKDFAHKLEKNIDPDFDNLLHIYWKNLPLNTDCNSNAARTIHPQACEAAYAAEAARELGGNDTFWKAHDELFAKQASLPNFDYREFAKSLGLDPDRFVEVMHSDAVKQRIREDVAEGKKLDVHATPTIYLWGRKVDRNMLANPAFVKRIRERFEQVRNQQLAKQKWERMTPKERAAMIREAEAKAKQKADAGSNGVAGDSEAAEGTAAP
ncbi:MAG TPA: vitamin K epoxide reductase family protein [Phycisphaerae bacterium]|nr:vitamin K epoxide reductase family protein [Phycisphaerae bacterium]